MGNIVLYDRLMLQELFHVGERTAQRRFNSIYQLIPEKKRKPEHKKWLPEHYVKVYLAIPTDTGGKIGDTKGQ